jgi:hypothetical protein
MGGEMKSRSTFATPVKFASILFVIVWSTEPAVAQAPAERHRLTAEEQAALARTLVFKVVAQQIATDSPGDYFPSLLSAVVINDAKRHAGLAVGFKQFPPGFNAVEQGWTPDAVAYGPLGEDFAYANTTWMWNGQRITTYMLDAVGGPEEDGALRLRLMFHEAGHTFAHNHLPALSKFAAHVRFGFAYPIYDAENSALARLEAKLLIEAYQQRRSGKPLLQIAREFVAIRQLRYSWLTAELVSFEQDNETNEGLAEYFGKSALRRWLATGIKLDPALAAAARLGNLAAAEQSTNAESAGFLADSEKVRLGLTREWAYHTGPAIGYLLDAAAPGWLRQLEKSPPLTLWDVLRNSLALNDRDASRLVETVEKRYDWSSLLAEEKQAQQQRKLQHEHMIADLEHGEGTVIRVEMASVVTEKNVRFYFDPRGIINVGEGREIYPSFFELKAEPDYDAKVERRVLVDKARWALATRLPSAEKLRVTASGAPVTLSENGGAYRDLRVVADSLEVRMRSARAVMKNDVLTITAIPK